MATDYYHCRDCGNSLTGSWAYAVNTRRCNGCQTRFNNSNGMIPCPNCGMPFDKNNHEITQYGKCYSCGTSGQSRSVIRSHSEIDALHNHLNVSSSSIGGCFILVFLISTFSALLTIYVSCPE